VGELGNSPERKKNIILIIELYEESNDNEPNLI
jgi:hypothetical protein